MSLMPRANGAAGLIFMQVVLSMTLLTLLCLSLPTFQVHAEKMEFNVIAMRWLSRLQLLTKLNEHGKRCVKDNSLMLLMSHVGYGLSSIRL